MDSETGPAVMPSGGEEVRVLYSWKRRLEAIVVAMAFGGLEGRGGKGREGEEFWMVICEVSGLGPRWKVGGKKQATLSVKYFVS